MTKDPYRYFRIEAQELVEGLGQGLLELEKGPNEDVVRRLLRHAHTLKGAARVVKRGDIGDLAHALEDILSPHRERAGSMPGDLVDAALRNLDRIQQLVGDLTPTPTPARIPVADATVDRGFEPSSDDKSTIRIAMADLDELLDSTVEAQSTTVSLQRVVERLGRACHEALEFLMDPSANGGPSTAPRWVDRAEHVARDLKQLQRDATARMERLCGELNEVRSAALALRLVPAGTLLGDLERSARDIARTLDKEVEVHAVGAETAIDAHVLGGLRKVLVHLVRNSVDHGIELPIARQRSGKPRTGRIDITIERQGHRVRVTCRDDGRGIDLDSVRRAALERGLLDKDTAGSIDEPTLAALLLRGGVSTAQTVTDVSGRGVGLDAVRHTVEMLRGEISLRHTSGHGVTVHIDVPNSLSSLPALAVQVDRGTVFIPLDSVRRTMRLSPTEIIRDAEGERITLDGNVIPFIRLRRVLNRPRSELSEKMQSAVIVAAGGQHAAIGVDRLGGARDILVRGIPDHVAVDTVVSGATFDEDGTPRLVLSPLALIRHVSASATFEADPQPPSVAPLLVIDDSLTTRMLEQSILESAGYRVELAVSGEDGLAKARQRAYAAFIVDVEMPGMSGFEFISEVRRDPALRDTPAVLVTSRNDPQDKRRGKDVGARAYIVKSEFNQADLLEAIRRLAG